jgi:hypothetical protein
MWPSRHCLTRGPTFPDATGPAWHVTLAERLPEAADNPGALPELLVPASVVFVRSRLRVSLDNPCERRLRRYHIDP